MGSQGGGYGPDRSGILNSRGLDGDGRGGSDSLLSILPLKYLSDSDTDLDLPDPSSFLQRSPNANVVLPRSRSRSPSNVPETPESMTGAQDEVGEESPAVPAAQSTTKAPESQGQVGRKRKQQQPVAKTAEVDSNLTLLDENTRDVDKAEEPRAKRGRPAATPTRKSVEKQPRSVRSKPAASTSAASGDAPHLCLLTTGLSEAQTARLRRAAKQAQSLGIAASISISSSPSELLHNAAQMASAESSSSSSLPTFTHLVTSPNKRGRTARTFKYLVGLVCGAWVVKLEWLLESVKAKQLVAESDFAIVGDTATPHFSLSGGPRQLGQLLKGYTVHVWNSGEKEDASSAHTRDEMLDLVRAAGAEIADKCPKYPESDEDLDSSAAAHLGVRASSDKAVSALPEKHRRLFEIPAHKHKPLVLVDISDKPAGSRSSSSSVLDAVVKQTGGTCACRNKSWLFDSISANAAL
ncbi:hypothetical protein GGI21_002919 [Coemansia aciculifera]|nr:hypothetical protein GGI21_002919 [Coemansia aciculifera]